jgi:hypothetical protein
LTINLTLKKDKIMIIAILTSLFIGCGEGSSDDTSTEQEETQEEQTEDSSEQEDTATEE